jgi:prepilin-type N-terminal cleavage/methylation domain-containing protein
MDQLATSVPPCGACSGQRSGAFASWSADVMAIGRRMHFLHQSPAWAVPLGLPLAASWSTLNKVRDLTVLALQAYLASPKVRRTLRTKPGQKGFSLIELVVVIAILGILIAIALPNFLNVQKDAQINQAKNALATAVKECAVKSTRFDSDTFGQPGQTGGSSVVQSANANVKGYIIGTDQDIASVASSAAVPLALGDATTAGADSGKSCYDMQAFSEGAKLPHFSIAFDPTSGETTKECYIETASTYAEGCNGVTAGTPGAGTW